MINWKVAAREYRNTATQLMQWFQKEQELRLAGAVVIAAAQQYKDIVKKPKTPFVKLVTGQDVNVQKAQQNLFEILDAYKKLIQSYSQLDDQNEPLESLDNTPPV